MKSVMEILELAAPLNQGFSIRVQNRPWHELVIADLQQLGPNGSPILFVGHLTAHGAAGFPEMSFEVERFGDDMRMTPLRLRRTMSSEVEHCAMEVCGEWVVLAPIRTQQLEFAKCWDEELLARGYIDSFKRQNECRFR